MTEAEWLACEQPSIMLDHLSGQVSDRKLRLFGLACCRWAWKLISTERDRQIVAALESCVDSIDGEPHGGQASGNSLIPNPIDIEDILVRGVAQADAWPAAYSAAFRTPRLLWTLDKDSWTIGYKPVSQIVREVFGNPFNGISLDPRCLTAEVTSLARNAYEQRALPGGELDPKRIARLADTLETSGCTERSVLDHLREPGLHVRGCWALDLVLGRS